MIRIHILTIFLLNIAFSKEEYFLNRYEYGRALYDNPRGISCKNCHGINGEEKTILRYTKRKQEKKIATKDIKKLSFKEFSKKLNSNSKSIMPKYYLSDDELFSIYYYLQNKEKN